MSAIEQSPSWMRPRVVDSASLVCPVDVMRK